MTEILNSQRAIQVAVEMEVSQTVKSPIVSVELSKKPVIANLLVLTRSDVQKVKFTEII